MMKMILYLIIIWGVWCIGIIFLLAGIGPAPLVVEFRKRRVLVAAMLAIFAAYSIIGSLLYFFRRH